MRVDCCVSSLSLHDESECTEFEKYQEIVSEDRARGHIPEVEESRKKKCMFYKRSRESLGVYGRRAQGRSFITTTEGRNGCYFVHTVPTDIHHE